MKFYKFSGEAAQQRTYSRYLVKKSETSDIVCFPSSKSKFKSVTMEIFGDEPELTNLLKKGEYEEDNFPSILKMYKYSKLYKNNQPILYNSFRDETDNKNESVFYSKIVSVKDSIFHLSHFLKNQVKINEGEFTAFYPHRRQNDFLFYYPDSSVRRRLSFKNNKPKSVIDCYENGKTHRVYEVLEQGSILYREIYNEANENILNEKGTGNEVFEDKISGKKINYEYQTKKLRTAYYVNENGEKIYQLCEYNAVIKKWNSLQKMAKETIKYPESSLQQNAHGLVLVKCIIEPSGLVSELAIVKGLDEACDNLSLDFLQCFKKEAYWKPGKVDGQDVKQEIILPIDFSIVSTKTYRNYYYNHFWIHQHMMQQQMMMQNNAIRTGGFR